MLSRAFLFAIAALMIVACANDETEDRRDKDPAGQFGDANYAFEDIELSSEDVIDPAGGHVYIVCFYGENDHDDLVRSECNRKYRACVARYGSRYCHKVVNPTQNDLDRIRNEGVVIIVTHSTPDPEVECETGVDIWDSPLDPTDVAACTDGPVVWFGCYGAQVADECPNVIPLQDEPTILDNREPEIHCRFQATILCIEQLNRAGQPYSQEDLNRCVQGLMSRCNRTTGTIQ